MMRRRHRRGDEVCGGEDQRSVAGVEIAVA
jgi:hypothetical protein